MNQNIEIALKQAFSLIEAGNLEDAKAILRPILESEKDNADVWWLYSHAVTDADTARLALNNVLRIDANYPDARDLLNQLEIQQQSEENDDILDIDKDPAFIPAMPSSVPGIKPLPARSELASAKLRDDNADDLPDEMVDDEGEEAFYRRPLFYVPLITILLIIALAIVIVKPFAVNSPSPQTTEFPTQIPVETIQSSALEITPTSEELSAGAATSTPIENTIIDATATVGTSSDFSAISSDFSGFTLQTENAISISDTNLGKTLSVSVCTSAGKELRELLPKAMETLAKASVNYTNQVQAISARMLDCSSNTTLLWLGSSMDDSTAFANATLNDKDYQAKWKPVTGS